VIGVIALLALLQASFTIGLAGPATSPEYLPGYVAQVDGLFSAQQLRTTLRTTRSDVGAAELLATGQVQLVVTSLDAAMRLGSRGGPPPRLVHGLTAAPPVALLVAPGRSESIRSVADLVGQTIAVPAPGTAEDQALGMLLARAEVPMHRVKVQSLGERGAVRALESGEVGAAVLAEPHVSRLLEAGQATVVVDLRTVAAAAAALGGPTVSAALFLRGGTELPPEAVRALRAALQAAVARLSSTAPGELQRTLPPAVIGSPADFAARLRSAGALYLPDGRVTAEALERSLDLVQARAPLPARVDLPRSARRLLVE
jgi:NitT/TauT family transport system substrate-binding protein